VEGLFFAESKSSSATEEWTSPAYTNSSSFQEKEVTVGSGEWALPGTLTLPKGNGPFPAVVLVHGSGPNDRDESVGPNKPFRDLAWGLASQGVAVLRYEKRTRQYAEKMADMIDQITVKEETIEDALLAVDLLRHTDGIDPQHIYVLGHSLGGMLFPRIGLLDLGIAGFLSMAGAARPLEDVVIDQVTYLANLDGTVSAEEKAQLEQVQKQVNQVKDPNLSKAILSTDLPLGIPAAYWLDLRGYQPAQAAKDLQRPILILQGGRDYQVTEADFNLWKKALDGLNGVEFKFFPALNHLFIEGEGKSTPAEYEKPGHVAEEVVNDIAKWILAQK
jgi:dienelactone hydrolase